ncbi:putative lipoprotein [Stutzerimonas stutzeri DSM 4166]|nr:putative lipoprotein [Stutzerimonas stutzeri DSM 4166]
MLLSARNDQQGRHYAVGYRLDGSQVFATPVAERCHDVYPHPYLPLAVFVGRRPSRESYLIDSRDGRLLQVLASPPNRHFYGHGVFHRDGEWFYTTENDTRDAGRGVLGVYRLQGRELVRVGEHATHGIGPHQLLWMPDHETLVIANGGIRTEADSREMMNLDAMEPSLVLLRRDGSLVSKEQLPERMNSVRHLAVAADGTVVSGQQYEGDPMDRVPLLAIKRPGQPFQHFPLGEAQRQIMNQYTASLAIHDELRLLAVTAPRGNKVFIWDLDSAALRQEAHLPDCAGVAAVAEGFVVSSGQGRCRLFDCRGERFTSTPLQMPAGLWDNHLRIV